MIFDELVLHNFGIYRGRHVVDLRPESGKPIILIGALNGGGKTTLLDALQLVLYGKLAQCSNRGSLAYDTFLQRCINRHVEAEEGSALELKFRVLSDMGEETIRLHRSWRLSGKRIKETVEVVRDGKIDPVCTEHWYEHVDEFIPSRMSSLFFFDGEKIEYFAEPENASTLLRSGLWSLLGLDLVEQLGKDLDTVIQRRLANEGIREASDKMELLQKEQDSLETEHEALIGQKATLRSELDQIEKRLGRLRAEYRERGGELYERRQTIEQSLQAARGALAYSQSTLQELAAADTPLLLAQDLIQTSKEQAQRELDAKRQEGFLDQLKRRDVELAARLKQLSAPDEYIYEISQFFSADYQKRTEALSSPQYLDVDPSDFQPVSVEQLGTVAAQLASALDHHRSVQAQVFNEERRLQGMPEPEELSDITGRLQEAQVEASAYGMRIEEQQLKIDRLQQKIEDAKNRRLRLASDRKLEDFAEEIGARIVTHADKIKNTLRQYRQALVRQNLHRLEELILESLQLLLHKQRLLEDVRIDPATYELTLIDAAGNQLSAERLSAGERQLLAVSIVWGLTKASGKPIPAVIDTPLGRLDGNHRQRLVDTYFPHASHQVILLSTDEEIDHRYFKRLEPVAAKLYGLTYDEEKQSSEVVEGYPWAREVV
ncbi:DNA sulfur modification protein DndD [Natronocella acetinitrilica]|uniref:DNA sulfur modification protein DndD n=1 Tax=Natronocella acetinitrilica TaxID=414046 RepID=A0AAE3G732_9GAMM|nr:DNA sulfur modification protein DndD [Natronocella acetinitrilica]MCP1676637.1 DNA sulfur modification protein DndD [Natronocella acetinitrilica]